MRFGTLKSYAESARAMLIPLLLISVMIGKTDAGFSLSTSSFLGGSGAAEEIRGIVIQSNGTIVVAANVRGTLPPFLNPTKLGSASDTSAGMIIRLAADGRSVLSVVRVAARVLDLSTDKADNLYVAMDADGAVKLNPSATQIAWGITLPGRAWRIDAGPSGICAVLTQTGTNPDASNSGSGTVYVYGADGSQKGQFGGFRNTLDLCADEASATVCLVGWRQANTSGNPVQIACIRGVSYEGVAKYTGYDWSATEGAKDWINRPQNNMADTRGLRAVIGADGLLYCGFECAGGNHIFRYQPWLDKDSNWIASGALIVGGDKYHEFYNSNSEHKTFVGRYRPSTGEFLLGKQFCSRLTTGAANALRVNAGNIAADRHGRLFLSCGAGSGGGDSKAELGFAYSFSPAELAAGYGGGSSLIIMSGDFKQRLLAGRVTGGGSQWGLAMREVQNTHRVVYGGGVDSASLLYTSHAVQTTRSGPADAWFAVFSEEASSVLQSVSLSRGSGQVHESAIYGIDGRRIPHGVYQPAVHVVKIRGSSASRCGLGKSTPR